MRKHLISLGLALLGTAAHAAPPSNATIEALLTAMHTEQVMQASFANMPMIARQAVDAATQGKPLSEAQHKQVQAAAARAIDIAREEFSWAQLQPLFLQIYRESFTDEEVAGLLAFYQSPAGMAFVEKTPVVMQKSAAILHPRTQAMMKRIQESVRQVCPEGTACQ